MFARLTFYRINMSFFDMRSIPYDESIGSQRLKLGLELSVKKSSTLLKTGRSYTHECDVLVKANGK